MNAEPGQRPQNAHVALLHREAGLRARADDIICCTVTDDVPRSATFSSALQNNL